MSDQENFLSRWSQRKLKGEPDDKSVQPDKTAGQGAEAEKPAVLSG